MANYNNEITVGAIIGYVILGIVVLVGIIGLFSTFFIVGAGERGVILTWGKVDINSVSPGLHVKIPFAQTVQKMDVQTLRYDADASAASKDLQIVSTKIAVNFHLVPEQVPVLYRDIGPAYEAKIIQPAVQEVVKSATAKFTAEELITKRADVKVVIDDLLDIRLRDKGIVLETTSITNFDFSPEFNTAIEQKVTAEQNALKEQNNLKVVEFQAQQVVEKAKGQAEAIQVIDQQLRNSPTYIQYLATTTWDGHLPLVTGGAMPFIQIPLTNLTN